jgi:glycerol-3-phosphate acyltransferase PlsY
VEKTISHRIKVWRKLWRLLGTIFPILYFFVAQNIILIVLGIILLFFLSLEFVRFLKNDFNKLLFNRLSMILKNKEKNKISATTWFLLSTFLTILLFEKSIAITALFFMIFGDSFAEVVGLEYGKHKIFKKSLEGSLACLIVCLIVGFILMNFLNLTIRLIIFGGLAATLIELLPIGLDDNLSMPLFSGILMNIVKMF